MAKKKIEKLTDAQIAKFPEYRDRWLKVGLSTQAADHETTRKIMADVYGAAGLKPPAIFIWLKAPLAGAIAAAMLADKKTFGDQVRAQVGDQVRDQVGDQVRAQVWDQVRAQVGDQVRDQVGDQVGDQVRAQVRAQVWDQVYRAGYGSHDANWLAFYEFFRKECGLASETDKLRPLTELAAQCGWFWPFTGAVVCTEKPEIISMVNGRLHADGGPSVRYSDGFSVYSLWGVRVPKELAETPADQMRAEDVLKIQNAEHRRVAIRKMGVERMYQHLQAERLDAQDDYELLKLHFEGAPIGPYLKMKCPSTGRLYIECVGRDESGFDPKIQTVNQAIAQRFHWASQGLMTQMAKNFEFRA